VLAFCVAGGSLIGADPHGGAAQAASLPETADDESVLKHRRTAWGYLRTGNTDLGLIQIEALEKALAQAPPEILASLRAAKAAAEADDTAAATRALEALARTLAEARRAAGTRLFVDCILEASAAHAPFDRYRTEPPDLGRPEVAAAVTTTAAASDQAFAACDAQAPAGIKADPEFRRLMDGARAGLALVPEAVGKRDSGQLFRILIELRSFERLMVFRFG
jgi:hypothetical protein